MVTVHGQESIKCPIRAGVPQGSILGPVLWNLYVNNLFDAVPGTVAYADDIRDRMIERECLANMYPIS